MQARSRLAAVLRSTPLRYLYHRARYLRGGSTQSDEARILSRLVGGSPCTFVEFGFHPSEYNCIGLEDFAELLVDGEPQTVRLARALLPKRIEVRQEFITLHSIAGLAAHFQ